MNQPNRQQRRAVEANARKSASKSEVDRLQKENEDLQRQLDTMRREFDAVKKQVELMRQAFNQNHNAYTGALAHVDGHLSVMRAVINDLHLESVPGADGGPLGSLVTLDDGNIHWESYYNAFNEHVRQENERRAAEAQERGTLVDAAAADEVVFGGDVPPPAVMEEPEDVQERPSGVEVSEGSEEPAGAEASG